jgi:hypothetical protein
LELSRAVVKREVFRLCNGPKPPPVRKIVEKVVRKGFLDSDLVLGSQKSGNVLHVTLSEVCRTLTALAVRLVMLQAGTEKRGVVSR